VLGSRVIYAFYADDKTAYPLTFRLSEQQDDEDDDHETKYNRAREIGTELEEEVGVSADTYLFDSWFAHDSDLPKQIESYHKDCIDPLRSNRQVTYAGEEIRVDAPAERIDTVERNINDDTYHIWVKKLSRLPVVLHRRFRCTLRG
jgi:hypothetical protein